KRPWAATESLQAAFKMLFLLVIRKHLRRGTVLGKVGFTDCTDRTRFLFSTSDSRFEVKTDGVLMIILHVWNRSSVQPLVVKMFSQSAADPQVAVLDFPKPAEGLRRRKRDWVIPPLSVTENHRGPYPLKVFEAHATVDGGGVAEESMEIIVNVIDQNDNKPVFVQSTYTVGLPESSVIGSEVITVEATDADEPNNANSDIRYRILSQDPQLPSPSMFDMNPISGIIRVTGTGLDREKYPQYTLVVEAADLEGEGLSGQAKVILTVTDGSSSREISVIENGRGPYPLKIAQVRETELEFDPELFQILAGVNVCIVVLKNAELQLTAGRLADKQDVKQERLGFRAANWNLQM
uniref:Cadherin domain-containing protein n=1 Tax=Amphilophus citrinellus TaxID=61819 RepID=A0A3Q0SHI2_AMPCI